jgi:hypothetical protein
VDNARTTRYHGVFAWSSPTQSRSNCNDPPTVPLTWGLRLKRAFQIDIPGRAAVCPLCGGLLRVSADVTDPELIWKFLEYVDSRAPPRLPRRRAKAHQTPQDLFAER